MDRIHPDWDEPAAFRAGFLARCAEEGLGADRAAARAHLAAALAKSADENPAAKVLGALRALNPLRLAGGAASLASRAALPLVGVSAAASAAGAYGLSRNLARDLSPEDVREQELTAAYNAYADDVLARHRERAAAGRPAR